MTEEKQLILAVDDEAGNLQLLTQILGNDYRLLCTKDGPRALELARTRQPSLILLDVMMPEMNGHEVCRRLKADPATAAIPVIFVTSPGDIGDETRGFECGAVDYVYKPVSPPIVMARVRNHLALARFQERNNQPSQPRAMQALVPGIESVTVADAGQDGSDIVLPLPRALLEQAGWKHGDRLRIALAESGSMVLERIEQ
jgi:CheY-like chemotaxis protein